MKRRFTAATLCAVMGMTGLAGCAPGDDDDPASPDRTLTVFAAASLTDAFTALAEDFEQANPGVEVRLSFDGSSGLVDQLAGGAPADVFASADEQNMDRAVAEGLVVGEPTVFAVNELTLITPPGNPAGITVSTPPDGARLVICEGVPCGTATRALADTADSCAAGERRGQGHRRARQGHLRRGRRGIVYVTDARTAGDGVEQIALAGASAHPNRYPIALVAGAPSPDLGQSFLDAVTGPEGQAVLERYGFAAQ